MNLPDHLIDIEAEQAVLGACLIDPDAVMKVVDNLKPTDFHDEGHQLIYGSMCELLHEGTQSDYLVLSRKIGQDNLPKLGIDGVRGAAYLNQLISNTPTSLNAQKYATIVSRLSTLRRLMGAAGDIAKLAYTSNGDRLDDVFSRARSLVDRIAPMQSDEAVLLWLDSLDAFFGAQIDRQQEQAAIEEGNASARVDFPWEAVRRYIGYVREGMLVGVAAESSVGKTAFLENLAEYWAAKQGLNVVFFHLELSHQVMLDRRMARHSGVEMREIENGVITDAMGAATKRMQQWPGGIHYVHCPGWTAQRICNQARMLNDKGICQVAIVDYLQKTKRTYHNGSNTAQIVGGQIETMKTCAEQLGIPWFLAAQFSNASKGKAMKTSDDIRDTGELEQKANIMITLHREIDQITGQRSPATQGRVDKNTNGPTGGFQQVYNGPRFMFADVQEIR